MKVHRQPKKFWGQVYLEGWQWGEGGGGGAVLGTSFVNTYTVGRPRTLSLSSLRTRLTLWLRKYLRYLNLLSRMLDLLTARVVSCVGYHVSPRSEIMGRR